MSIKWVITGMSQDKNVNARSVNVIILFIISLPGVYSDLTLAALPIPPSLKTVEVPLPADLDLFVQDLGFEVTRAGSQLRVDCPACGDKFRLLCDGVFGWCIYVEW